MKQAHIVISGFVQKVGFRHFVRSKARELGLKGWVKNTPDSQVEAFFAGEEDKVKQMIKYCKQGPFLSEVKDVKVEWIQTEQEEFSLNGFEILTEEREVS